MKKYDIMRKKEIINRDLKRANHLFRDISNINLAKGINFRHDVLQNKIDKILDIMKKMIFIINELEKENVELKDKNKKYKKILGPLERFNG